MFSNLKHFCLFLGYPRSGHSLIGAMIDAHPNAIIAHELNIAQKIKKGVRSKNEIFNLLIKNSKDHLKTGKKGEKLLKGGQRATYSYMIPGQPHAQSNNLMVIGDKRATDTTLQLGENPELLKIIKRSVGVPLKFIHVVRNPYDNVSTMSRVLGKNALDFYANLCRLVQKLKNEIGKENVLDIYHEDLINRPGRTLRKICQFLDLPEKRDHISACIGIVFKKPNKTRKAKNWAPNELNRINKLVAKYPWLQRYESCDMSNKKPVFLLAGQSNMVGQGDPAKLPGQYKRPPDNIAFYQYGHAGKLLAEKDHYGLELSFGRVIADRWPNKNIAIVKSSTNGSSLYAWEPEWSKENAKITENVPDGPLYSKTIEQVIKALGEKPDRYLAAIMWMQGCRDCRWEKSAKNYRKNFIHLIKSFRKTFNDENLPFIFGRVNPGPAHFKFKKMVQEAQAQVAKEMDNVFMVDTSDIHKKGDNLHYSGKGLIRLGEKFANKFINKVL